MASFGAECRKRMAAGGVDARQGQEAVRLRRIVVFEEEYLEIGRLFFGLDAQAALAMRLHGWNAGRVALATCYVGMGWDDIQPRQTSQDRQ